MNEFYQLFKKMLIKSQWLDDYISLMFWIPDIDLESVNLALKTAY